jgi:hypothetical protein
MLPLISTLLSLIDDIHIGAAFYTSSRTMRMLHSHAVRAMGTLLQFLYIVGSALSLVTLEVALYNQPLG